MKRLHKNMQENNVNKFIFRSFALMHENLLSRLLFRLRRCLSLNWGVFARYIRSRLDCRFDASRRIQFEMLGFPKKGSKAFHLWIIINFSVPYGRTPKVQKVFGLFFLTASVSCKCNIVKFS